MDKIETNDSCCLNKLKTPIRIMSSVLFLIFLSSCHVGPNFVRPSPPEHTNYTKNIKTPKLLPGNGESPQHLVRGRLPAAWWQMFQSPTLDNVVQQAIMNNPSIETARARLAAAQQSILMARGAFYPQIDASLSAQREKGPPLVFGLVNPKLIHPYNIYSLGPIVSFVPDVFGLTAREVELATAFTQNQAYHLEAAQLSVTGNIVSEALTIASVRLQIQATEEIIANDIKNLNLVRKRLTVGIVDRSDFLLIENQLEKDRTLLPPLKQQLSAAKDALAILIGKSPGEWDAPDFELNQFMLPPNLPLIFPSELVSHRPDIMAAEANLHASSAAIGVAIGKLFPKLTLSASLTPTALTPSNLFHQSNLAWDIFGGITGPIFHGGTLIAQKHAAVDLFHSSLATYQETVLEGLRQVADTLHALEHDAEMIRAEHRMLSISKKSLFLQRQKFSVGTTDLLSLLDAERSYQQARVGYARARAQRYLDSAHLFVALGGGWNNSCSTCVVKPVVT